MVEFMRTQCKGLYLQQQIKKEDVHNSNLESYMQQGISEKDMPRWKNSDSLAFNFATSRRMTGRKRPPSKTTWKLKEYKGKIRELEKETSISMKKLSGLRIEDSNYLDHGFELNYCNSSTWSLKV